MCVCVCGRDKERVKERERERERERRVQLSHFVKGDFAVAVVPPPLCMSISVHFPRIASLADTSSPTFAHEHL